MSLLSRFLRWHCRIHPQFLDALGEDYPVPAEVSCGVTDMNQSQRVTLTLTSVESSTVSRSLPERFALAEDPDDPLTRARAALKASTRPTLEGVRAFTAEALAEGRVLDGFLALLEHSLSTDDPVNGDLRALGPVVREDDRAQGFLAGLAGVNDPARAPRAAEYLEMFDREGLQRGHVADIFRANAHATAKDPQRALAVFTQVLQINPWVAGIYKDVGDIHHRLFRCRRAWAYWDTGRGLAPTHPMFGEVNALEQGLESRYPEMFLPKV